MTDNSEDVLKGTLDMLILKALELAPMHGWGIGERIAQLSQHVFQLQTGTLYPALQRLQVKGWVRSEWRKTPNNRRARYYTIAAEGRKQLGEEINSFDRVLVAIQRVLQTD
jgi:transcriptional regulator